MNGSYQENVNPVEEIMETKNNEDEKSIGNNHLLLNSVKISANIW